MTSTIQDIANNTYDYVVVGGGTTGLVVAARLSADPSVSVAVLEAGESHAGDPNILVPGQYGSQFTNPKYDWAFRTTPQRYSNNKTYMFDAGKGLGGSSAINFQMWMSPSARDIDAIGKLGNPGWNWKEYNKYFKRCETYHPGAAALFSEHRGTSGPIQVIDAPRTAATIDRIFHETQDAMGLKRARDPYSGVITGGWSVPSNIHPRTLARSYSANAYYAPVQDRPNLAVLTKAIVTRVIIKETAPGDWIATGVEFVYDGKAYIVKCKKEVILSAGTFKDPQILEFSGIGQRAVLKKIGVDVKIDLPGVGENVQDHILCPTIYELDSSVEHDTIDRMKDLQYAANAKKLCGEGKRLPTVALSAMSHFPLSFALPKDDATWMIKNIEDEVRKLKASGKLPPGLIEQYDIQLDVLRDPSVPNCEFCVYPGHYDPCAHLERGKTYMSLLSIVNHPFSRGTIHAISKDPLQQPEIDPHRFEIDHDLEIAVQMILVAKKMSTHEPLKSAVMRQVVPGPETDTRDGIREYIKNGSSYMFHTVGSCSMLPRDKNGVVGPDLVVYGTRNLRVADISVIPLQISVPTQAMAYVIGEKAANLILGI